MCLDGEPEHTDHRRPQHAELETVTDTGGDRIPVGDADELAVHPPHPRQPFPFLPVDDELGGRLQELDELG